MNPDDAWCAYQEPAVERHPDPTARTTHRQAYDLLTEGFGIVSVGEPQTPADGGTVVFTSSEDDEPEPVEGEGARDQAQHQHVADGGAGQPGPDPPEAAYVPRSPSGRNRSGNAQVRSCGGEAKDAAVAGGLEADRGDHEVAENGACPRETRPLGLKPRIAFGRS